MTIKSGLKIGFLEVVVLSALCWLLLFPRLQGVEDYVFIYPFNLKDGSIYWALNIYIVFACLVFFGNIYYSIPYYLKKRGALPYIIFITVAFIVLLGLEELIKKALLLIYQLPENIEVLYGATYDKLPKRRELGLAAIYRNAVFLALSFGYRYMKDWKQMMIEQNRQQSMIAEKSKVELDFLKAQVNPHFLFNTLNNIYAITKRNNDDEAGEAITKLSNLTRFMLYDSASKFINLSKEIAYIQDYIAIQQLRYADNEVMVNIKTEGDISKIEISPLLLIPFVENAFKHGVAINRNSIIKIHIKEIDNGLSFSVKNKIHRTKNNHVYSGIGIKNVRKRLELVYPNRHSLTLKEDSNNYEVNLTIQ